MNGTKTNVFFSIPTTNPVITKKTATKTEHLLTPSRHLQWISANGGKVSDNPCKVLHSMLNWYNAEVSKAELRDLPQIRNLYDQNELVGAFTTFCLSKQISLERGNKTFEELFSCNDPENNPILIVVSAYLHNFEQNVIGYPNRPQQRSIDTASID